MSLEYQNQPITHLMRNGVDLLAGAGGGSSQGIEEFLVTMPTDSSGASSWFTFTRYKEFVSFNTLPSTYYYQGSSSGYGLNKVTSTNVLPEAFRPKTVRRFCARGYPSKGSYNYYRFMDILTDGTVVCQKSVSVRDGNAWPEGTEASTKLYYLTTK